MHCIQQLAGWRYYSWLIDAVTMEMLKITGGTTRG